MLLGRGEEKAHLASISARGTVATISGPPGVGKSALARDWSQQHDAIWCDLYGVQTEAVLMDVLSSHLSVQLQEGTARQQLLAALSMSCVVLDNADLVAAPLRELLSGWAPLAGAVLVTARAPVCGRTLSLRPLPAEDAYALFVHHAQRLQPDIAAHPRDRIDSLLARLDGLPLAIELAAARMSIMGPGELEARLSQRFAMLREPGGTALDGAIALSWGLLSPAEQRVLGQLALFRGGFSLQAAEALCETEGWIGDTLQRLVACGLLCSQLSPLGTRFSLLESIRDFALQQAPASEALVCETDRWLLRRCEALLAQRAQDEALALRLLQAERINLLDVCSRSGAGAVRAALCLEALVSISGNTAESLARLEAVEPYARSLATDLHARWRLGIAHRLRTCGRLADVQPHLDAIPEDADPTHHHEAALLQAQVVLTHSNPAQVIARLDALLQQPLADSVALRVWALYGKTQLTRSRQGSDGIEALNQSAQDAFEKALALAPPSDTSHAFWARAHCALLLHTQYRTAEAIRLLEPALRYQRSLGRRAGVLWCLYHLAIFYTETSQVEAAVPHLEEALQLSILLGQKAHEIRVRSVLGAALHAAGALDEAGELLHSALALLRRHPIKSQHANTCLNLGALLIEQGRLADAEEVLQQGMVVAEEIDSPLHAGNLLTLLVVCQSHRGDIRAAEASRVRADAKLRTSQEYALPVGRPSGPLVGDFARSMLALSKIAPGMPVSLLTEGWRSRDRAAQVLTQLDRTEPALDCRFLILSRLLSAQLALKEAVLAASPPPAHILRAHPGGDWFSLDGGEVVPLAHRPSLRRLFAALLHRPGSQPLDVAAMLEAGWPGERLLPEAGANRVYATVRLLRKQGLRPVLERVGGGYRLEASVYVQLIED